MTLLDLDEGQDAEIRGLRGDPALLARMSALGVYAGRRFRFVRAGPFAGPLLIEDAATGARIMIARALAAAIEVRREGPTQR